VDFDLAGVDFTPIEAAEIDPADSGNNRKPFDGVFHGNGHVVRNWSFSRSDGVWVGLFSASKGTIENLTLENFTITGSRGVGALAGATWGPITNVHVTDSSVTGLVLVGGMVGVHSGGNITGSTVSANVGIGSSVGGLGGNTSHGVVRDCWSSGTVTGRSFSVAGLIGSITHLTVLRSHSSSTVFADDLSHDVGGLIGGSFGTVRQSYATGGVTGIFSI